MYEACSLQQKARNLKLQNLNMYSVRSPVHYIGQFTTLLRLTTSSAPLYSRLTALWRNINFVLLLLLLLLLLSNNSTS